MTCALPGFSGAAELLAHTAVGRAGEETAVTYLRLLNYKVLGQNIRLGKDEIDIVAIDPQDDVLVFCEVKSRAKANEEYAPGLNITPAKKASMLRAARAYVAQEGWERGYRLDVVCVEAGRVSDHWKEIESD